jgi:DUF4097 and DUF4098 domain-containing protein YvlB
MSDSTQTEQFTTGGPVTATVRAGAGAITVVAEDDPIAAVSVSPYDDSEASRAAAEQTVIKFSEDRLRIETPQVDGGFIFRRSGRVRVDLRLPLDSVLRANVGSADVHAEGRLSDVSVQAGSGDTFVTHAAGDLSVEAGSGDVRAEEVGGALRARTGSGDVTASVVTGPVVVNAASGDVEIEEASDSVRISTASGDVRIGSALGGQVKVNSASGDVSVGVPPGTKVWLDLGTMSGSTNSDLDMTGPPPEGKAQLRVVVHTMSGDIAVHRATRA